MTSPFIRLLPAALAALCLAAPAAAQAVPSANVRVRLTYHSITIRGDTTQITLGVAVDSASPESLFVLTIDAPTRVITVHEPPPRIEWAASVAYRGRTVAAWAALTLVAPGDTTPTLWYSALGLPGIDSAWAEGYYPPPIVQEDLADSSYSSTPDVDPLHARSVQFLTVGIEPMPPGATRASLTARLDSLRGEACALGWITSDTLCAALHEYLNGTPPAFDHFRAALNTAFTPGGPVSDEAYGLLRANLDYLLNLAPRPRQ
ncbi:MAG: hypothetical protein SF070_13825 [Gemmatimonadota bacterium]|nr:hypothetical protein [Gemmatimonadota bacterium]